MSKDRNEQDDPLARACELVGRFLYHFGRVERKIDDAVTKLLGLNDKLTPVVTAIDFAKEATPRKTLRRHSDQRSRREEEGA
jgi:hypothetical protein